jgi:hypothetical protein
MRRHQRAAALMATIAVLAADACRTQTKVISPASTSTIADTRFQITGTVTKLSAERATTDPIAPPFTINVAARGVGGAEIDGARVNGKPAQINWNAGQPLPLRGAGKGLDLDVTMITVDTSGVIAALDGAARVFLPGTYTAASSVAVGSGGLATPVDSATFTVPDQATLSTRGNAILKTTMRPIRIEGRTGALTLAGRLTLSRATGDRSFSSVTFGPGPYEVTLTPARGGYTVAARLEGRVIAS